ADHYSLGCQRAARARARNRSGTTAGSEAASQQARALQVDHSRPAGEVSGAHDRSALRRDPRRRIHGRADAAQGLRPAGSPETSARSGRPVRDGARSTGSGRFCRVLLPLGQALRAPPGARLFATSVAPLLSEAGHADPVRGSGGGLRLLRRRTARNPLRPDGERHHPGSARPGRKAGRECRVPSLRGALGLSSTRLPALSSPDQGQGGAADPVSPRELRVRPRLRLRRRPEGSGRALASPGGQCASPSHDPRAPSGALLRGRAVCAPAAGVARLSVAHSSADAADTAAVQIGSAARGRAPTAEDLRSNRGGCAVKNIRDQIRTQLADLKMPGSLEALDVVLSRVDSGLGAAEAISAVLGAQITLRNNRRLQAAMRSSRLPAVKTLSDFDFSFQPSLKREQIESLATLGFIERRENVVFLGPPGVGKTHLAIGLAIAAAQNGRRVYYGTLADLITSLEEA